MQSTIQHFAMLGRLKHLVFLVCLLTLSLSIHAASFTSVITGNWEDGGTWGNVSPGVAGTDYPSASDDAVITAGTNVTLTSDEVVTNLTVQSGGILDGLTNNQLITIDGSLVVNGTLKADSKDIIFNGGAGTTISGLGTIFMNNSGKNFKIFGNTTISSGSDLYMFGKIQIQNNIVVTNNGTITADDDIEGKNASSKWINGANATVNVKTSIMNLFGILTASASGNTVEYFGDNQNVTTPLGSTYYNLISSGKSSKTNTQLGDLIIGNDITLLGGTYKCNGNNITVAVDWNNTGGVFDEGSAKVTFNSSTTQNISSMIGETFYDWEKTGGGTLSVISSDIIIVNVMTMTSGNINTQVKKITLGTAPGSGASLTYVGGSIIGYFERWHSTSIGTSYLFPVGTAANYNPVDITINTIANDGSLIGRFVPSGPGNNGLSLVDGGTTIYNAFVDGYWELTTANLLSVSDFDLDATGNGFIAFGIDANTRLLTRANAASAWIADGSHVSAVGNMVQRANITTLSGQFSFGDDTNCTPPGNPIVTSPDTDVCTSTSGTYSVTNNPGNTYVWSISPASAGTFNPVPVATDNSVTIDWGTTGQVVSVICIESNTCTSSDPDSLTVNTNSIAPSSLTGRLSIAKGTLGEPYSITGLAGYTYAWTLTDGTVMTGQGTTSVTIDWDNTVGTGLISIVATSGTGCPTATSYDVPIRRYEVINSNGTGGGDWNTATTWDCSCVPISTDNVRILSNDVVTLANYTVTINNMIIQVNGTLERTTNNKKITISADLVNDGLITLGGGNQNLVLEGISTVISGGGTINITSGATVEINTGHKSISSTAMLTITGGDVDISDAGIIVTNNGSVTFSDDLTFKDGTNTCINSTNSTLNIGGEFDPAGILNASSNGNTVNYNGAVTQNIVTPLSSIYFNLTASNTVDKKY
ncbi:MAG: G8 domain-containing protein [Flavobacteriales bacterium]|nr:G8 domain-containing protein [Flavobacteriales bacterium]